jgi:hypothetical protein
MSLIPAQNIDVDAVQFGVGAELAEVELEQREDLGLLAGNAQVFYVGAVNSSGETGEIGFHFLLFLRVKGGF